MLDVCGFLFLPLFFSAIFRPPILLNVDLWHWHYVDFMLRCIDGFRNGQFDSCLFQDSTADASCSEVNSGKTRPTWRYKVIPWRRNGLQQQLGVKLPSSLMFDYPTMKAGNSVHSYMDTSICWKHPCVLFLQPEHLEVEVWCILVKVYCKDFLLHASDPCMEHFGRKCPIVSSNSATWTKFAGVSSVIFDWKCPALAGVWWSLCSYRIGNVRYASMNRFSMDIQTSLEVLSKISVA